jgi:hypothetical protein
MKHRTWGLLVAALIVAGCGAATKRVTVTVAVPPASTTTPGPTFSARAQTTPTTTTVPSGKIKSTPSTSTSASSSQNNAVINQAAQAPDNQAQLGAAAIQRILTQKLGLNDQLSFNLNRRIARGDNGGDCYVKLGAHAVNFEYMSGNILR